MLQSGYVGQFVAFPPANECLIQREGEKGVMGEREKEKEHMNRATEGRSLGKQVGVGLGF